MTVLEINRRRRLLDRNPRPYLKAAGGKYITTGNKPGSANFDCAVYDAIGESDRMTLRFKKA